MPRNIPSQYDAPLASDSLMLAIAVKITTVAGVISCFTTTDQFLNDYEGITPGLAPPGIPRIYRPIGSVASTSLKVTSDTGVDNMEIDGILDADYVTDSDIRRGVYDGARVEVFLLDPTVNPVAYKIEVVKGYVGTITLTDGKYTWEVRSTTQLLKQQFGKVTLPTCRCRNFCDAECAPGGVLQNGHTISDYTYGGTVKLVHGDFSFEATPTTFWPTPDPTGDYLAEGNLVFLTGNNSGASSLREVKSHTDTGASGHRIFALRRSFPFPVVAGDQFNVTAGCQKRFRQDCIGKFGNPVNFHGEPEMPGNDTLIQMGRPPV